MKFNPNSQQEGSAMSEFVTLKLGKVSPADVRSAIASVEAYRANGGGSNRTNWDRMSSVLASVFAVKRTGRAIEVTDVFHPTTWGQKPGQAPAYNLAHRALSADLVRPFWHEVRVHALMGVTFANGAVTGRPNSTAVFIGDPTANPIGKQGPDYQGSVRVFYAPAE